MKNLLIGCLFTLLLPGQQEADPKSRPKKQHFGSRQIQRCLPDHGWHL